MGTTSVNIIIAILLCVVYAIVIWLSNSRKKLKKENNDLKAINLDYSIKLLATTLYIKMITQGSSDSENDDKSTKDK